MTSNANTQTKTDAADDGVRAVAVCERVPDSNGAVAAHNPVSDDAALLSIIERAARDPSVDLDKMERLFAMKERMEDRRSSAAFNEAMAAAQAEIVPVAKNRKNEHTGARYADLHAIADVALPIVHKHGFGLSFSQAASAVPGCIGVVCRVTHAGGHSETYQFDIPTDSAGAQGKVNKTATQALGSTLTYGRRYAVVNVFNIAITDSDGNSSAQSTSTPVTEQEFSEFRKALAAKRVAEGAVCEMFSVESLEDLTRKQFGDAVKRLEKTKARPQ